MILFSEILHPVALDVADADTGAEGGEDIVSVAAGVHPVFHDLLRGALADGDVFGARGFVETLDALEGAFGADELAVFAVVGVVFEIAVFGHIRCVVTCGTSEIGIPN